MSHGAQAIDTTFREVLSQVGPADLVRLLTCFYSTADNPGTGPTHSLGEVLTAAMQLEAEAFADDTTPVFERSHAPLPVASGINKQPTCQAHTPPPPTLPMSDIKASGTLVRFSSLTLIMSTKPMKCDCSSYSVSNSQHDKRACIRIKIEAIDDGGHRSNVNVRSAHLVAGCDTTPIKDDRE